MLEWVKVLAPVVVSWPVVGLLGLLAFRRPLALLLDQIARGEIRKARVGPFEVERELRQVAAEGQQAIVQLQRLNQLMAESRLLELEITEAFFGSRFTQEQRDRLRLHISELRGLTKEAQ